MRFSLPAAIIGAPPETPILGRDVHFANGFETGPDGDYRTIEGLEALQQALLRRLVTQPGEYAVQPTYGAGLSQAVKASGSRSEIQRLRNRVIEQLSADARVRSVPAVSVTPIQDGIRVTATVSTQGETVTLRPLEVRQ